MASKLPFDHQQQTRCAYSALIRIKRNELRQIKMLSP
ncbi:hypothetical protein ACVW1C_004412 [Bradyrhizobium sp. USDA 4011]